MEKVQEKKPKKSKLYNARFKEVEILGEGSYGKVYKVESKENPGVFYALKKFKECNNIEGLNYSAIREISILKELDHENIEKVLDAFYGINCLYVQYEYIECVLSRLIKFNFGQKIINKKKPLLNEEDIKGIMLQILTGLAEIHNNGILHRDLAPSNILIDRDGIIKIADFGLSRFIGSPGKSLSRGVTTIYYRPPEICCGAKYYSFSVDIWSAGCILAEMLLSDVLFKGTQDIEILKEIFTLIGIPNDSNWPDAMRLEKYIAFKGGPPITIRKKFEYFSEECRDLLEKMLVLDPNKRISANEALKHSYFTTEPLPSSKEKIAEIVNKFLYVTKQQNKKQ